MSMKMIKLLDRLTNKKTKKERTQLTNVRNEKGVITADLKHIKRIIKGWHEKVYAHEFKNLDEMEQFFESKNYQNSCKEKQITEMSLNLLNKLTNN